MLTLPLPHRKLIVVHKYREARNPNHTAARMMNAKITMTTLESDSGRSILALRWARLGEFLGRNDAGHEEPGRIREAHAAVDL